MAKYNPEIHHRRSIRLKNYDYSQPGGYFITLCLDGKDLLLGDVVNGQMCLNQYGKIVDYFWRKLPKYYPYTQLDEFVVMPNHFHGLIIICDEINDVDYSLYQRKTIGQMIQSFKTFSAKQINRKLGRQGVPVWQRDFYDQIIRDERHLHNVRQYIVNNPCNWKTDDFYDDELHPPKTP